MRRGTLPSRRSDSITAKTLADSRARGHAEAFSEPSRGSLPAKAARAAAEKELAEQRRSAEEAAAAATAAHAEAVGVAEAKVGALEKTCAGHVHDMSETCP